MTYFKNPAIDMENQNNGVLDELVDQMSQKRKKYLEKQEDDESEPEKPYEESEYFEVPEQSPNQMKISDLEFPKYAQIGGTSYSKGGLGGKLGAYVGSKGLGNYGNVGSPMYNIKITAMYNISFGNPGDKASAPVNSVSIKAVYNISLGNNVGKLGNYGDRASAPMYGGSKSLNKGLYGNKAHAGMYGNKALGGMYGGKIGSMYGNKMGPLYGGKGLGSGYLGAGKSGSKPGISYGGKSASSGGGKK